MKELIISIVGFVLLLTVFCIVVLTSNFTDKGVDKQICCSGSTINESESYSASIQGPINHIRENGKKSEPKPDATRSNPTEKDADGIEPAFASPHYRINYHRTDPNDIKSPDTHRDSDAGKDSFARKNSDAGKNDSEGAADVVE
jgi:hypothetical protein